MEPGGKERHTTSVMTTPEPASQPLLAAPISGRRTSRKAALRKEASYVFKYLILAQITVYLEAGSIPCLLDSFALAFDMSVQEQGWLGSVVYVALCLASPLCGVCLQHYDAKWVLGISLVLNNLCVLGFAMTPTGHPYSADLLIFARALIGFTQAFLCVYTPLWVDAFSPRERVAGWMSYLQGSVPLGVMFGYLFGSVSNWVNEDSCGFACWRWPFVVQFILVLPLMFGVFFVPSEHISIKAMESKKHRKASKVPVVVPTPGSTSSSLPSCSTMLPLDATIPPPSNHPHILLEQRPSLRFSFNNGQDELNSAQRASIRASYVTPRFRMDSYDIDLYFEQMEWDLMQQSQSNIKTQYGTVPEVDHESDDAEVPEQSQPQTNPPPPPPRLNQQLSRHYSLRDDGEEYEEEEHEIEEDITILQSCVILLSKPIFSLIVLGLSAIYFVVTGVQFWCTIYLQKNFNTSVVIVNGLYVLVAGTGPILGVFFGGALIDRAGGYIGLAARAKALGYCVGLGLIAFLLGILTTFLPDVYTTAMCLWLLLFFGGSILPACTGIFISASPVQLRSLASSVSVMVFNIFGYALAPVLTGVYMDFIISKQGVSGDYFDKCDEACVYRLGFRFCLAWSIWSFFSLIGAYIYARRQALNSPLVSLERRTLASQASTKRPALLMH
ncbi:Major Facilitator Superfamily (MFS) [Thraustotheca clavata]|uniref:Major Facilitator Superfamily (MFS) n=1 Tax=Thraustotheca clavata TaxID=74557 RepID=A0A1V9YS86_9STRA|nr:Major Facilitator Superfamily (MFS) [Thraustotheca clavata]